MKLYGFLEPAQIEFYEAVSFYNHQREYLGDEFAQEVLNTINRLKPGPSSQTNPAVPDKSFPVQLIYQIRGGRILIVAVAHSRRKPKYWRARLRPN